MNAARAIVLRARLRFVSRGGVFGKELLRSLMVVGGFAVALVLLPSITILPFRTQTPLFYWFDMALMSGTLILAVMLGLAAGVEDEGTGAQFFLLRLPIRGWRVAAAKLTACLTSLLAYAAAMGVLCYLARIPVQDAVWIRIGRENYETIATPSLGLVPHLIALIAFPLACGLVITRSQVAAGVFAIGCIVVRWLYMGYRFEESTLVRIDSLVAVVATVACLVRMEFRREGERPWPFLPWARTESAAPRTGRAPIVSSAALRLHLRVLLVAIAPQALLIGAVYVWMFVDASGVPYGVALFLLPATALAAGVMGVRPAERDGLRFIGHALPVSPLSLWTPRLATAACLQAILAAAFSLALLAGTPSADEPGGYLNAWVVLGTLFVASHFIGSLIRLFLRNAIIAWFGGIILVAAWQACLGSEAFVDVARGKPLELLAGPWVFFVAVALPLVCLYVSLAKSNLLTLGEGRRFLAAVVLVLFLGSWGMILMTASLEEFLLTLWLEARS